MWRKQLHFFLRLSQNWLIHACSLLIIPYINWIPFFYHTRNSNTQVYSHYRVHSFHFSCSASCNQTIAWNQINGSQSEMIYNSHRTEIDIVRGRMCERGKVYVCTSACAIWIYIILCRTSHICMNADIFVLYY